MSFKLQYIGAVTLILTIMTNKNVYLTAEKLDALKKEIDHIKKVIRPAISLRIKDALELRDLKENSEYHAAKDELAEAEGRIEELEFMVRHAKIIKAGHAQSGMVELGTTVVVDVDGDKETYTIVGSAEVDVDKGYISNESPIGRALIGKKKGDTTEVVVPAGKLKYRIVEVK